MTFRDVKKSRKEWLELEANFTSYKPTLQLKIRSPWTSFSAPAHRPLALPFSRAARHLCPRKPGQGISSPSVFALFKPPAQNRPTPKGEYRKALQHTPPSLSHPPPPPPPGISHGTVTLVHPIDGERAAAALRSTQQACSHLIRCRRFSTFDGRESRQIAYMIYACAIACFSHIIIITHHPSYDNTPSIQSLLLSSSCISTDCLLSFPFLYSLSPFACLPFAFPNSHFKCAFLFPHLPPKQQLAGHSLAFSLTVHNTDNTHYIYIFTYPLQWLKLLKDQR